MDAVSLIRIRHDQLVAGFKPADVAGLDPNAGFLRGAAGITFRATPLDDATLVWTPVRFGAEPDELALAVRRILGDVLDRHDDARGVFVFPDAAAPKATTYDAVVAEVGELGVWVPRVGDDYVPRRIAEAPDGSLEAQVRNLMSALPTGALSEMQQAMSAGDPEKLEEIGAKLERAMADMGGMEKLTEAMSSMLQDFGGPSSGDLSGHLGLGQGALGSIDPNKLMEQAAQQLEAMQKNDPGQYEQLQKMFGGFFPGAPPAEGQGEAVGDDDRDDEPTKTGTALRSDAARPAEPKKK